MRPARFRPAPVCARSSRQIDEFADEDDDPLVPYADHGPLTAKRLRNGTLKTYKDFPHGMITTHADTVNADLLAFIKG